MVASLRSRSASLVLPMFRSGGYPDEWVAAGDDRARLAELAKSRRRLDAHAPPKVLRRRWAHRVVSIDDHALHLLSLKAEARPGAHRRLMLYLHGGGYVFGPTTIEWLTMARIARLAGADLAIWDYPKVPESTAERTLPATHEAWDHLADRYGTENIVVVGFSAGGGLALSLLLHRRGLGLPQPAGAVLCSPWLDLTVSHPEVASMADGDVVLSVEGLRRDGELYAGCYGPKHPLVSPYFSEYHELPPILLSAGSEEILLPDCRDLADRITAIGGPVRFDIEAHGQHAGVLLPTPEGSSARNQIVAFMGRVLGP